MIASEFIGAYAPKCYPGTLFCLLVCFFFISFFEDGLEEVNMMDTVILLGITSKYRDYEYFEMIIARLGYVCIRHAHLMQKNI